MNMDELVSLRRDIHAHPELAFEEKRTAALVCETLRRLGVEVHSGIGGTGVVAALKKGSSKRAIGLRADMDALPILEANQFAHASQFKDRMHACGHDGHVAMLLAAAGLLVHECAFDGTVYLIFQPGEESGRGARAMIEDGLFARFPMDAVFALHNWPGLPVGHFAVSEGPIMAACNTFEVSVQGRGGHAALPDLLVDPVIATVAIVQALQTILSRNVPPHEVVALSVAVVQAGNSPHVVADTARIAGTVRTYSSAMTDLIETRMAALVEQTALAYGCTAQLGFVRNCAATINAPPQSTLVREALVSQFGPDAVVQQNPAMTAEDFAFMLEVRPGCYFWIGNGDDDGRIPGHGSGPCLLHNPSYDFNDQLIPLGARAWVGIVERCLGPAAKSSMNGPSRL
jgi:hippurate hydrolase